MFIFSERVRKINFQNLCFSNSWKSPEGLDFFVRYVADSNGYRVIESNAVPASSDGVLADGNQGSFKPVQLKSAPEDEILIPEQDLTASTDSETLINKPAIVVIKTPIRRIVKKIGNIPNRVSSRGRSLDSTVSTTATEKQTEFLQPPAQSLLLPNKQIENAFNNVIINTDKLPSVVETSVNTKENERNAENVESVIKLSSKILKPITTDELPEEPIITAELPEEPIITAELPEEPIITAELPEESIITAELPGGPIITAELPVEPIIAAELHEEPIAVTNPTTHFEIATESSNLSELSFAQSNLETIKGKEVIESVIDIKSDSHSDTSFDFKAAESAAETVEEQNVSIISNKTSAVNADESEVETLSHSVEPVKTLEENQMIDEVIQALAEMMKLSTLVAKSSKAEPAVNVVKSSAADLATNDLSKSVKIENIATSDNLILDDAHDAGVVEIAEATEEPILGSELDQTETPGVDNRLEELQFSRQPPHSTDVDLTTETNDLEEIIRAAEEEITTTSSTV